MKTNRIQILCRILKTDLVYEASDGTLTAFFDILSQSPLMQSDGLRRILREGCEMQKAPFIHFDEYNCYFAGIKTSEGHLYMGPMCHHELKGGMIIDDSSAKDEELIQISHIIADNENRTRQEQVSFILHEEEENDYAAYRHSFKEEQMLMQAVREGRPEDAVRLAENMDRDSGRLSKNYMHHRKNLAILALQIGSKVASSRGINRDNSSSKARDKACADFGRIAKTDSIDLASRVSSSSRYRLHRLCRAIPICPNTSWRISIAGTTPRSWPRCGRMPMRKTWAR